MTEKGGDVGLVRDLPGVDPALVRALVDALESMEAGFAGFAERLGAGTVHGHAFGKLIDAAKVRDAYHDRLPATLVNLAEAAQVAREFRAEFAAQTQTAAATAAADATPTAAPAGPAPEAAADAPATVPPQREARE